MNELIINLQEIYNHSIKIEFSNRVKDYYFSASKKWKNISVKMSSLWRKVPSKYRDAAIHSIICDVLGWKTPKIHLNNFDEFIFAIDYYTIKKPVVPELKESFDRVNEKYFKGMIRMPNIKWGRKSKRKLGGFDFLANTLTISSLLKDAPLDYIDYIMYHELLHKFMKYNPYRKRKQYHTRKFKELEKLFHLSNPDEKVTNFVNSVSRKTKKKKRFSLW